MLQPIFEQDQLVLDFHRSIAFCGAIEKWLFSDDQMNWAETTLTEAEIGNSDGTEENRIDSSVENQPSRLYRLQLGLIDPVELNIEKDLWNSF